ncbi:MAG: hypothetical protein OJF49_001732 [Ktedonobacterales bacterium]|jgi:uncharacterized protein (TIGR00730 family)|nr:MAG: hypothetical protein OJF49_001732 [Ktedonobacterales bacterium]
MSHASDTPTPEPSRFDGFPDFEHSPSWRIFRIMSEFVEGFTFIAHMQRSVTIFGSARLPETHPSYQLARQLGFRLAKQGCTVVTGGGPGIMQAANQGAYEGQGDSVGINIQLPHEQRINPYVTRSTSLHYFFSRKVMLDFSADAYVFFPGGYGTLDEFFELLTLVQTGKLDHQAPIIMVGRDFWEPLAHWMRDTLAMRYRTVAPSDLDIWTLTDDLDEVLRVIETGVEQQVAARIAATGRAQPTVEEKMGQATRHMAGTEQ